MRIKKRLILTFIIISILVTPNLTLANSDTSINNMAEALDTLSILKGNGNDYNLSGQLKRSQAAAFLVRLLGVEKKVIEDKYMYINDEYSDVPSSQWYAYYIGYVTSAGVVYGYDDGTFRPDEYVTEKEFTKMILGALNYIQGIDYEWDNIYNFGYSIGLFDDSYKNKKSDNVEYTRQEAITLMYNALKTKINKLDINMTEKLIDRDVFSVEQAIEVGILVDTIKTDISKLDVISDRSIKVLLSEEVKDFNKENIVIYKDKDETEELNIEEVTIDKDLIVVTTDKQISGVEYKIKFLELEDIEGFKTTNLEKSFSGYVDEYVESNYFEVSKVKAISKNVINIYYTHPIGVRATQPIYYTIMKGDDIIADDKNDMGISYVEDNDKGVSIFIRNDNLEEGVEYSIKISGKISSKYNVDLNDGKGEEIQFIGTRMPNEEFILEYAEAVNDRCIEVTFNKLVDKSTGTRRSNYILIDKNGHSQKALGAVYVGVDKDRFSKVRLRFPTLVKEREYDLQVKDVSDSYEQMYIDESYPIYYYEDKDEDTTIDYAYAENKNTLIIYFNKILPYISSAKYSIEGSTIKDILYDSDEPDKITIYTDDKKPLKDGVDYKVKISNVRDEFGKNHDNLEYTFEGTSEDFDEIDIDECRFISDNKLYVEFDKNINYSSSLESKCELVYYKSDHKKTIPADDISRINNRTIIVKFDNINDSTEYRFRVDRLEDYSKQFTSRDVSRSVEW